MESRTNAELKLLRFIKQCSVQSINTATIFNLDRYPNISKELKDTIHNSLNEKLEDFSDLLFLRRKPVKPEEEAVLVSVNKYLKEGDILKLNSVFLVYSIGVVDGTIKKLRSNSKTIDKSKMGEFISVILALELIKTILQNEYANVYKS